MYAPPEKYENKFNKSRNKSRYESQEWYEISQNQNIHMEDIENNLDLAWNFFYISRNQNLTIDFIKKYENKLSWTYVSSNKNMILDIIKSNPDLP